MTSHRHVFIRALFTSTVFGLMFPNFASASIRLSIDGPAMAMAPEGSQVTIQLTAFLGGTETNTGIQGWSIGLQPSGAEIVSATTVGTDAALLSNDGFERTDLTTGPGNEGALSALVLSFSQPIVLPFSPDSSVLFFELEGTAPAAGSSETWTVSFVDGLQGPGEPQRTIVTESGDSQIPSLTNYSVEVFGKPNLPSIPEPSGIAIWSAMIGLGFCFRRRAVRLSQV